MDWKGVGTKWAYFQDGAVMFNVSDDNVLARYTSNGDVAASLTRYKGGWVALTGPHPEATEDWCKFCYQCAGMCVCVANRRTKTIAQASRTRTASISALGTRLSSPP